jgi:hypothetical protein
MVGMPRTLINRLEVEGVFDADAMRTLTAAFDTAWLALMARHRSIPHEHHQKVREIMAKHIVEMARLGERDKDRLMKSALLEVIGHV